MNKKGVRPEGRWSAFEYSDDANALRALGTVANRLRRIDELSRRIELEKPGISAVDYVARLRKRKEELTRAILGAGGTRRKAESPSSRLWQRGPYTDFHAQAPLTLEHYLASQQRQIAPSASEIWEQLSGECKTYVGCAEPVTWWIDQSTKYVTHDSTYGFYPQYIGDMEFPLDGHAGFYQHLNDDASIWRDDTPDSYRADFVVGWELPRPNCDVLITCTIDVRHDLIFTNGADDGGHFATSVSMVHSDKDGNFGTYDLFAIQHVLLGNLSGENMSSGRYDSGTRSSIQIQFGSPKDSKPRVCLGHHFFLIAQDGLVYLYGDFYTHTTPQYGQYGYNTPLLRYTMEHHPEA